MPPIRRQDRQSTEHLTLEERQAAVIADADVLVVGGGPAGIGAAIGAAEAGARVVLAERHGYFGGCATAALVMPLMSYHTQYPSPRLAGAETLFPTDHGRSGGPVIGGVLRRFVDRLVKRGGALSPSEATGYVVPFDPEVFKTVALELLDEAGVEYLLHSFASGVLGNSNVEGAAFEGKSGPVAVTARVTVDCTGDADLAASAGARYVIGRERDGAAGPMSLMFRMVGFDRDRFMAYVRAHPEEWFGVHGLVELVREATLRGDLELHREDILMFGTPNEGEVLINSTRVIGVFGTDVRDLTAAEVEGRRQMTMIATFLRKYVPGFQDAYVVQSGSVIGVRGTRRISGGYTLSTEDVLEARKHDDVIARGSYPLDIHNPAGPGTLMRRLPPGEAYDIPLRCLLPSGVDNLCVAGKCISATYEAHSSLRAAPICFATGQAAGVCASLAAQRHTSPNDLDATDVQHELVRQGADLRGVV